jgi:hypothetical protein
MLYTFFHLFYIYYCLKNFFLNPHCSRLITLSMPLTWPDNIANALCVSFIASSDFHTFQGLALKHPYQHTHTSQRSRAKKLKQQLITITYTFYTAALARCKFLLYSPQPHEINTKIDLYCINETPRQLKQLSLSLRH